MTRIYGRNAACKGAKENVACCIAEIAHDYFFCQCSRKRGHGEKGLFCKQHAKKIAEGGFVLTPKDKRD